MDKDSTIYIINENSSDSQTQQFRNYFIKIHVVAQESDSEFPSRKPELWSNLFLNPFFEKMEKLRRPVLNSEKML